MVEDDLEAFYKDAGVWDNRWWVGGYELGIAFPPDWVGEFVYDEDTDPDATFVENEVVNFEANFYLPHNLGLALSINTFAVTEEAARFLQATPSELAVIA